MMQPSPDPVSSIPPPFVSQAPPTIISSQYFWSAKGLTRLVCLVLILPLFICAIVWNSNYPSHGGGWVIFVSIFSLLISLALYLTELFRVHTVLTRNLPQLLVVELLLFGILTAMYLSCGIVAAVFASEHPSIPGACFFSYAVMIAYGLETYFAFEEFRTYSPPPAPVVDDRPSTISTQSRAPTPGSSYPGETITNPTY